MFSLPNDFVSGSLENTRQLFNDLKPILLVIFGIGVAGLIWDWFIDPLLAKRRSKEIESDE